MIRLRVAGGLLAAGMVAAAAACAPAAERTTDKAHGPVEMPVAATVSPPPHETLSPLIEQRLPNVKNKTFTSAIVYFPPGSRAVPHRHGKAFVYAYVLEGSLRSRIGGEPVRGFHQGQSWVEPPGAHHVLTENISRTRPARLLVIFISNTGDKIKVDDPPG
jgi:quercetin dioxygenase-like cupin family protein